MHVIFVIFFQIPAKGWNKFGRCGKFEWGGEIGFENYSIAGRKMEVSKFS